MQKLTDGQEIQYWNKIRQKSFYGGKWGEKSLEVLGSEEPNAEIGRGSRRGA